MIKNINPPWPIPVFQLLDLIGKILSHCYPKKCALIVKKKCRWAFHCPAPISHHLQTLKTVGIVSPQNRHRTILSTTSWLRCHETTKTARKLEEELELEGE